MNWESDRSLQVRMVLTLAFVLALPFGFVYTLLFLLNTVGLDLLEFATNEPWNGQFYVNPVVLTAVVLGGFAAQYAFGRRVALRSAGAREVDAEEYPDLHATVTRLAARLDLPTPTVAVSRTAVPNAFTVGRSPESATVVVTEGLLDRLDDEELAAVLAHELAHVKNRDVAVMTLAYFLPTLTYFVAMGAYFVLKGVFHGLGGMGRSNGDGKGLAVAVVVLVVSSVLTLAVSAAFWVGSFLFFRLLSRYREFAADRGAVSLTGEPLALASALRTLDDTMTELPDRDLREQDGGLEALYVAPIDAPKFGSDRELISRDLFPETHPPTAERIERLRDLDAELEGR
ncbi:M48 family metalloprotease [Halorussus salilacus]|uniref:M48 family metalloprotease n=1 Tax=Halorussus salilacus TaxID=2953750 RepID=UPI00209D4274|nr:M48 family metalloprotease [Halorussus salilacus]USZ66665.1 M48 family metalloprotease [Halorussus salilacus]